MKIVVVSSLTPIATANYLVQAMKRAGDELLVISDVASPHADVTTSGGSHDVSAICRRRGFAPDLAFFIEGGTMQVLPTGLERLACPAAWYGIDSHTNCEGHVRLARLFDLSFICHKQFLLRIEAESARPAHWLPVACPRELLPDPNQPRTIDVGFVGALDAARYPQRVRRLEAIREVAGKVEFGLAPPAEMMQRYARSKIVFNSSFNNDLNMRYFEAMGAGAALLTDVITESGVEELFEAGRHYLVYRSDEELIATIKDLLADPEKARVIGGAARAEIEARHTYDHRVERLKAAVKGLRKSVRPGPADYFAAFAAVNMPAAALQSAGRGLLEMGSGTRWQMLNKTLGMTLLAAGAAGQVMSRALSRLRRQP